MPKSTHRNDYDEDDHYHSSPRKRRRHSPSRHHDEDTPPRLDHYEEDKHRQSLEQHRQHRSRKRDEQERRERERQIRMQRLRAENDAEEARLAAAAEAAASDGPSSAAAAAKDGGGVTYEEADLEDLDEEEQMKLVLGITSFGSTKNQAVEDNSKTAARGAASKNKARKYRQYMNRKGGFNRPLDKMA